jgi:septal ring factor EnvC (AmiA/AmiB activator)
MLEIDYKELTTNYNQLNHDYQSFKQYNKEIIEQMETDNQRRTQYDKDFKQLQQQLNHSGQKEKQLQEELNKFQNENERLTKELRQINNEYQTIKTKINDYEEQVEG